MKLLDALVATLFGLQVNLIHAQLRLEADTDAEALHDLRIALQRLRSLLRPLQQVADLPPLYAAVAALSSLSAPIRDLEVLAQELEKRGCVELAATRRALLPAHYAALLDSVELERVQALLDIWPAELRQAQRNRELRHLPEHVGQRLHKQLQHLLVALATPGYERHRLRLLIKRVRYAREAYPQLAGLDRYDIRLLRRAQSALGDWHDHLQWCTRAEQEPDLAPLREIWRARTGQALAGAEHALCQLAKRLTQNNSRGTLR